MVNKTIPYKFKLVGIDEYELILVIRDISSGIINKLFKEAKIKMKRKHNVDVKDADPDVIQQFVIEKKYYNLLSTGLNSQIRKIKRDIEKDGINVIDHKVKKAVFIRDEETNNFNSHILIRGLYNDKRHN